MVLLFAISLVVSIVLFSLGVMSGIIISKKKTFEEHLQRLDARVDDLASKVQKNTVYVHTLLEHAQFPPAEEESDLEWAEELIYSTEETVISSADYGHHDKYHTPILPTEPIETLVPTQPIFLEKK